MDLPIACTLTDRQLAERRRTLLEPVQKAILRTHRLPAGYAYDFPADSETATALQNLISLERQCCPFLAFNIVETTTSIRLEVTGPLAALSFMEDFFGGLDNE